MAIQPAESFPDQEARYSAQDYPVFRYYIEQQKQDPDFLSKLADKLWGDLTSEEQVVRTALNASFFPDNLEDRERSIKVGLLRDYIDRQIADARALNQAWASDGADPLAPAGTPEA